MLNEPGESSALVTLEATANSDPQPPAWWAQALVLLRQWWTDWTLLPVCSALSLKRKAGHYETCDFLLVLLCLAVSYSPSVRAFYAELAPVAQATCALWLRKDLPSRSALSRWLLAVDDQVCHALHTLFCPPCWSTAFVARRWAVFMTVKDTAASSSISMAPARPRADAR